MSRALFLSLVLHGFLVTFLISRGLNLDSEQSAAENKVIHASLSTPISASGTSVLEPVVTRKPERLKSLHSSSINSVPVENKALAPESAAAPVLSAAALASVPQQPSTGQTIETAGKEVVKAEISPDGIRQYGLNLAREARNYRRFPVLARQRGLEGEVSVVVGTVAGVAVPQVSLSQGSGIDVLDNAALEMVRLAVGSALLPESLRGREFALTLPIRFKLED